MNTGVPGIAIVTPVRDRLSHLMATLPTWCSQEIVREVVVCDFGSDPPIPNDITDLSNKIKIVVAGNGEPWNKGLAQNIGILAAECEVVLKSDCDIFYQGIERYLKMIASGSFVTGYIPTNGKIVDNSKAGCFGQIMLKKTDWRAVGGYHEFMHGWGFDDQDLYNRLEDEGIRHSYFNLSDIRDIPHDDKVRGGARLVDDFRLSVALNIRSNNSFQNTRNKIIAGAIPWDVTFERRKVLRRTGPSTFECKLEPRSALEIRSQLVAAFLASRFWEKSDEVELELRRALIDERMYQYTAKAMADLDGRS